MTSANGSSGQGKRAVVAGGAGFIGSHLCEALLDHGMWVECLDNLSTGRYGNIAQLTGRPRFRFHQVDVVQPWTCEGEVDLVLHLASPASPQDYLRLPVQTLEVGSTGTLALLRLAQAKGARFVLASTSEVYGDPAEHPQRETYWGHVNPIGPRAVYDEAKRFAEAATAAFRRDLGADTGIVRLFNSFGPRMRTGDGRMVPNFVHQALTGRPITIAGTGQQSRTLCYVTDTVACLTDFALSADPGPMNIGGSRETTVLEVAHLVRELTGSSSPLRHVPLPVDDPTRRRPDITRAREVLGWQPRVSLREGLRRTITWMSGPSPWTATTEGPPEAVPEIPARPEAVTGPGGGTP
ncbi:GDP-mannose 4,6-dehydratase [Streptomyces sp. NPDC057638]|uniref:GDP-mannose 4,6-dehydratase n=1 Tax=Streptomyces sp. NPDC057638 TaxID=3346190 RepID=UPI00369EE39E